MKSAFNRSILALAAIAFVAGASQASAQQKALKKYEVRHQGVLDQPARRLVPRRRDRSPEGPGATVGAADRRVGRRTRRDDEKDQAAGGLQDRSLRLRRAGGAADGLGRQGHAVRRFVRPRQRLRDQGQWRQERGQDGPQGRQDADRHRVSRRRALRRRYRQAPAIRQRRSQSRQSRRGQGGL